MVTVYRQVAYCGFSPEYKAYMEQHPIPIGRGSIAGRTLIEGENIQIHDVLADPEYMMKRGGKIGGSRTVLAVPLLREGMPIGVIVLQRKAVQPFTEKQIELVATFADQAVIAIENVRLFDEVQARTRDLSESLEQQTATSEVLQGHQPLARRAGACVPGDTVRMPLAFARPQFGIIFASRRRCVSRVALHGAPPAYAEARRRELLSGCRRTAPSAELRSTKQVVQIDDIHDACLPIPTGSPRFELGDYRTVAVRPDAQGRRTIGAIAHLFAKRCVRSATSRSSCCATSPPRPSSPSRTRGCSTRCVRRRLRLQQQTATADVLGVISARRASLSRFSSRRWRSAVRICEAEFGNMFRYDGEAVHPAAGLQHTAGIRGASTAARADPAGRGRAASVTRPADEAGRPHSRCPRPTRYTCPAANDGGARFERLAVPDAQGG